MPGRLKPLLAAAAHPLKIVEGLFGIKQQTSSEWPKTISLFKSFFLLFLFFFFKWLLFIREITWCNLR